MFSFMGRSKGPEPTGGQPLELVHYNTSTKQFEVGKEALSVLNSVRAPVAVLSVCGRARQGKSFILNQLLGQSSGFVVAPTHRPCTKGLWMWSTPVERTGPDGGKYYLVMLDTEGIDAWDQTGQYSVQIFSLAVLLSSLFVYNQMGGIDEAALDRLSLVTEMTKHIRVRAASGDAAASELGEFTPSFLWLLRDFYLQLEEDGRQVSPREYLETALAAVPATSGGARAKNQIRESIKSLFPDRDCYTLVRPMSDESKLAHLEAVPPAQLRPEFRDGLARLMTTCFARAQPKRVGSQVLSGAMLAGLTEAYVDAINHGAVPTIATAWQGVTEAECRRAADEAERKYHAEFRRDVAPDEAALVQEHHRALEAANALFVREAVGDADIKEAHKKKWLEAVERSFKELHARKLAEAKQGVETMINDITMKVNSMSADASCSPGDVTRALEAFLGEYAATAAGPTKWQRLVDFLRSTLVAMVRRAESDAAARDARAAERVRVVEAALTEARTEVARLRTAAGNEEGRVQALSHQLQAAHKRREEEKAAVRAEVTAAAAAAEERLQAELRALRGQMSAAESSGADAASQLEIQRQRAESLARQLARSEQEASAARQARTDLEATLHGERAEKEVLEGQLAQANAQLGAERTCVRALEADLAASAAAMSQMEAETERACGQFGDAGASGGVDVDDMETEENGGGSSSNVDNMTIQDMKEWLTERGHEGDVWSLSSRKTPRVKKADWIALVRSKMNA